MIRFVSTQNILEVFETYKQDYPALNWNESLKDYMNDTISKFYSLKGTLYYINYKESLIGHFTLYDINDSLKGLAMFHIRGFTGMSIGQVNSLLNQIKEFINKSNKGIYGFCNNVRILRLYRRLGYDSKFIRSGVYLVYNSESKNRVINKQFEEKDFF